VILISATSLRDRYAGGTPGYHLNERHWNTVTLDGSVPGEEVLDQHTFRGRRLSTLRIPDRSGRNHHAAQQTPSAAANHAPHASVSQLVSP
jgi:hypothetical protein